MSETAQDPVPDDEVEAPPPAAEAENSVESSPPSAEVSDDTPPLPPEITQDALMEVEVTLRFCVGTAKAKLRDVASIQPGYVFETETPVENPVTIELNGAKLGRGELVMVGDRIGVLVKEYRGHE